MPEVKVGSIWRKISGKWGGEDGQLLIIERVWTHVVKRVQYRYLGSDRLNHSGGVWPINLFVDRCESVKDI